MKGKILAILNLILTLTIITGLSYSHWQDTVQIQGTIKMSHGKFIRDPEKLPTPTPIKVNNSYNFFSKNRKIILR